MSLEGNKEIVRRHVGEFPSRTAAALAAGDPSMLASDFTDDIVWVMPASVPRAGAHRGMPAVLEFLRDGPSPR